MRTPGITNVVVVVLLSVGLVAAVDPNYQANLRQLTTRIRALKQGSHNTDSVAVNDVRRLQATDGDPRLLAEEHLQDNLAALSNSSYDVSVTCLNHTEMFLEGLVNGDVWALRMIDAAGKPPSDILDLNVMWLGSYDECLDVQAIVSDGATVAYPFTGRYCTSAFPVGTPQGTGQLKTGGFILVGVCVPNSCSPQDVTALINTGIFLLGMNTSVLPPPTVSCQLESLELSSKAITVIAVLSVLGAIMVLATAYDIVVIQWYKSASTEVKEVKYKSPKYGSIPTGDEAERLLDADQGGNAETDNQALSDSKQPLIADSKENGESLPTHHDNETKSNDKYQPGIFGRALLSFSMYTNALKILNTSQPSGTLSVVNGIRFLSMSWVILGHTYSTVQGFGSNSLNFTSNMLDRWTFQVIGNGTLSVDSFFALSGLLVAYLSLKGLQKVGGALKFNWVMFYFHRFWRLTPPYMLFMLLYIPLIKYWSSGPVWSQTGIEKDECQDTWWRNLLYINNFFDANEMCMAWSWYLANDMQFYIISPLLLIPLYYSYILGTMVCAVVLLACFLSTGLISSSHSLVANLMQENPNEDFFGLVYDKPWTRIGPYVVGIFTGYLLYTSNCRIRLPKFITLCGWLFAAAMALSVIYGLYDPNNSHPLSTGISALYTATNRTAWGLAVCWVVFACATGHGGIVNTWLSWEAFVPLGRLTYCAYLVHPVVMSVALMTRSTPYYLYDLEMIYLFLGHMCLSYMAAFCVSLAFEAPMMALEKVLLGRGKNS